MRCQFACVSTVVFIDSLPEKPSLIHEIWSFRVLINTCRNAIERDWKTFSTWRNLFGDQSENIKTFSSFLNRAVAFSVDYRTENFTAESNWFAWNVSNQFYHFTEHFWQSRNETFKRNHICLFWAFEFSLNKLCDQKGIEQQGNEQAKRIEEQFDSITSSSSVS